jgi:hypothetical protein
VWRESRRAAWDVGIAAVVVSTTPLVTVRQKSTGVISKINLDDLDETVEPVVPDVTPRATVPTKRELDRAIWREVRGWLR